MGVKPCRRAQGDAAQGTSSPFNIKRESLTIRFFDRDEIAQLYGQHTAETGQVFTEAAVDRVWDLTRGQPYLVNCLGDYVVRKNKWRGPIDVPQIDAAKEQLIVDRPTHIDSLMALLREDRVRRVMEPILLGSGLMATDPDDEAYCRDLGLIAGECEIANPIYREVIPRWLASAHQRRFVLRPCRWLGPDGRLDMAGLRDAFGEFWREHGEILCASESYSEAAAHLVVMGFLQRVVNGGGHIHREYAAGMGRMDIVIRWPLPDDHGNVDLYGSRFDNHLWELKVWSDRHKKRDPLEQGLVQVGDYLARVPCASATLLIFDQRATAQAIEWEERLHVEPEAPVVQGVAVTVMRA